MNRITITDEELRTALGGAAGPINVCGPDGKMLGYFTPLRLADFPLQISDEEIERRFADKDGPTYTTAEVLKYLESL